MSTHEYPYGPVDKPRIDIKGWTDDEWLAVMEAFGPNSFRNAEEFVAERRGKEVVQAIWKFPFAVLDLVQIEMPVGSEVLCVQTQSEQPCLWAKVNPFAEKEMRQFRVVGTGHVYDQMDDGIYIGTFQLFGGSFVGHVFMKSEEGLNNGAMG